VYESTVLRKTSGSKSDQVKKKWRSRLHGEDAHDPYSSTNVIRLIKDGMRCERIWHVWERRETHTEFWWGNLKDKRLLGRQGSRFEDNI